jgi:hypothetical protein
MGNGKNRLDVAGFDGTDWSKKVNAAYAQCSAAWPGCVLDATGLTGAQTMSVNVTFGSSSMPTALLLPSGLTLTRASGVQIIMGGNSALIGSWYNGTVITGNDGVAAITTNGSPWNPYGYDVQGVRIQNSGTGPCIGFQGVTNSVVSGNVLMCQTGLVISAYSNTITNNIFGSTGTWFSAGILMDAVSAANANTIANNYYQGGGGTGLYILGGYKNVIAPTESYQNLGLGIYNAAIGTEIHGPYMEGVSCTWSWAASTYLGLGSVIKDSAGDCEIVTTAGTTSTSAPTWPAATHANLGATTTDGSAVWTMYTQNVIASTEPAYNGCTQVGILVAPGIQDTVVDGSTGPSNCILDLDAAVTGDYTNSYSTVGNLSWGTGGVGQYAQWAKIYGGYALGTAGSGFGSLNAKNDYTAGGLAPWYGWQLDADPGRNCTYYGYCGHNPLHTGLSIPAGIQDFGRVSVNPVPNPVAPSLVVVGTPGTTTLNYYVVAHCGGGVTLPSSVATITNAPNTLNSTNYVNILPPTSFGYTDANTGFSTTDVYSTCTWDYLKGNTSTSIATSIGYPGFNDQGGSTSAYTAPTWNSTGLLYISGAQHTPASSFENCYTGEMIWDTGYLYICTVNNTWKRTALASF